MIAKSFNLEKKYRKKPKFVEYNLYEIKLLTFREG